MEARELRIGNSIYYDELNIDTGKWHQKEIQVELKNLVELTNGRSLEKNRYNPIPLTEWWLVKVGGKKVNQIHWCINFGELKFYCQFNKKWYSSLDAIYLVDRIQYVHQLQNLYFALTGEELTLKP